jgi:hypothetical protein
MTVPSPSVWVSRLKELRASSPRRSALLGVLRDGPQALNVAALMAAAGSVISLSGAIAALSDRSLYEVIVFGGRIFLEQFAVALPVCLALLRLERSSVLGWRRHLLTVAIAVTFTLVVEGAYLLPGSPLQKAGIAFGVTATPLSMLLYSLWKHVVLALLASAYIHSRGEVREVARHLARLRREQVAARRRLVEARLVAIQARVDPQFFLDMLAAVQRIYPVDAARAERLLDELTAFLRAALPRLRTTSSTMAQECDLARSYVLLRTLAQTAQARLDAEVPQLLEAVPFPPGVLLPLVEGVLRVAPTQNAMHLAAETDQDGARVLISASVQPDAATVAQVRSTLMELFGGSAELVFGSASNGAEFTTVRVPHAVAA